MRVLVGCEFSGTVRDAFLARGHDAMSADLIDTESPGPHYIGDVRDVLDNGWDLAIFHPPCTYLAGAGARWMSERPERFALMEEAATLFLNLLHAPIPAVAVENPRMHHHARKIIGPPTQVIHPWEYGHPEQKATALWLRGLPPLIAGEETRAAMEALPNAQRRRLHRASGPDRARIRSLTFPGIARAMAAQWGNP